MAQATTGQHHGGHADAVRHGTRSAYVGARCRCDNCRSANTATAADRRRTIAYGRWHPFADAAPVREHIARLRAAGMGIDQVAALAGVGGGTVRQLVYGNTGQVRTATAAAILAVPACRRAAGALVPAGAVRAMITDLRQAGHEMAELARQLGRTPSGLARSLTRTHVLVRTEDDVARLYHRLTRCPRPDRAAQDITAELPNLDEVAVERAMAGEQVLLTREEQLEAIQQLTARGTSDRRIARLLRISPRTVARRRAAAVA